MLGWLNDVLLPLLLDLLVWTAQEAWDHPFVALGVLGVLLVALAVAGAPAGRSTDYRDPKRTFSADERREAVRRAGGRCEHKHPLWSRCSNTPSQGDHIFPWSKGGATAMTNHQALCAFHNNRKSASVPTKMYVLRLERRRRRYFPVDVSPTIEWRPGAAR